MLELPDELAEQIEFFQQRRGQRWAEELTELLRQDLTLTEWDEALKKPGPEAAGLSGEEAERLAVEGVREARREPFHTRTFSLGRSLLDNVDDVAEALAASEGETFR